jgi:hypothetical protein
VISPDRPVIIDCSSGAAYLPIKPARNDFKNGDGRRRRNAEDAGAFEEPKPSTTLSSQKCGRRVNRATNAAEMAPAENGMSASARG